MKPLIGITCEFEERNGGSDRSFVHADYYDAIKRAGGVPVLLPVIEERADLESLLDRLDGVVLTGGDDLHPRHFGAELSENMTLVPRRREEFDLMLARSLRARRSLPVLGICYGIQLVNVACGGGVVPHIPDDWPGALQHKAPGVRPLPEHPLEVAAGSLLGHLVGGAGLSVNTSHHQSVTRPGEGVRFTGFSPDGIVEALELPDHRHFVAVQWHPEKMPGRREGDALFASLVGAAREAG